MSNYRQGTRGGYQSSRGSQPRGTGARGAQARRPSGGTSARPGSASGRPASNRPASGRPASSRTSRSSSGRPVQHRAPSGRAPSRGYGGTSPARKPARRRQAMPKLSPGLKVFVNWAAAVFEAAVVVFILFFVCWPLKSEGLSMSPTLVPGDRVFISRAAASMGNFKTGDVVICSFEDEDEVWKDVVMRIIGKPKEVVTISNGIISVNGTILDEPYLQEGMRTYPDTLVVLGSNQYFVLGDNRPEAGDSRLYGYVNKRDIQSKVLMRFYPFNTMKIL